VGNVFERFKLAETTCCQLLVKLSESKQTETLREKNSDPRKAGLEDWLTRKRKPADEVLSDLTGKSNGFFLIFSVCIYQFWFEAQVGQTQKKIKVEVEECLDTEFVAKAVRQTLEENGIAQKVLMQHLGIGNSHGCAMLSRPTTWVNCTETTRDLYKRMHEWSKSKEKINALKHKN
jgi:hypothetical protein